MWNEKFDQQDYLYGTEPNDFLKATSPQLKPQSRILCIGEGEGRNAVHLAQLGHKVTAVDASTVGLEKANKLAEAKQVNIQTHVCDLAEFNFSSEHWDAIVAIFCHLPQNLRKQIHQQVPDSLTSGGLFILEAYHPNQLPNDTGGPKNIEFLISAQDIKAEVTNLAWLHLTETERVIVEGSGHTGMGFVTQAIGQK